MRQRDVNKLVGGQTIGKYGDAFDDMPEEYEPLESNISEIPIDKRCSNCDATLEQRAMPDGIEEWCPVCNTREKDRFGDGFIFGNHTECIDRVESYSVRGALEAAMKGGYMVRAELKHEIVNSSTGIIITAIFGYVREIITDMNDVQGLAKIKTNESVNGVWGESLPMDVIKSVTRYN